MISCCLANASGATPDILQPLSPALWLLPLDAWRGRTHRRGAILFSFRSHGQGPERGIRDLR